MRYLTTKDRDEAAASAKSAGYSADAIRLAGTLRAALAESARLILIVAAQPGDGVSTVVAGAGAALAMLTREPVLLVDTNLRTPGLHEAFGVDRSPGLVEAVRDGIALEDALRATTVPSLSVLPAGAPLAEGIEGVLQHERYAMVLRLVRERFRYVLLEAPPMLRFADWVVAAQQVDAAVLVVRALARTKADAAEMTRLLQGLGTKVLGAVITRS
jgi:Mrp family chromosome partitioning ATPase